MFGFVSSTRSGSHPRSSVRTRVFGFVSSTRSGSHPLTLVCSTALRSHKLARLSHTRKHLTDSRSFVRVRVFVVFVSFRHSHLTHSLFALRSHKLASLSLTRSHPHPLRCGLTNSPPVFTTHSQKNISVTKQRNSIVKLNGNSARLIIFLIRVS